MTTKNILKALAATAMTAALLGCNKNEPENPDGPAPKPLPNEISLSFASPVGDCRRIHNRRQGYGKCPGKTLCRDIALRNKSEHIRRGRQTLCLRSIFDGGDLARQHCLHNSI